MKHLILACQYTRDHRDAIHYQKIPKGYKIIGIRGHRLTSGGLHVNDFLIWKPPPHWLSFAQLARKFKQDRATALAQKHLLRQPDAIPIISKRRIHVRKKAAKASLDNVASSSIFITSRQEETKRVDVPSAEKSARITHTY